MNAIKFTTTQDEATIKLWWKAGGDGRHVQLLDENGNQLEVSKETSTANTSYITKFKLTQKGTYNNHSHKTLADHLSMFLPVLLRYRF